MPNRRSRKAKKEERCWHSSLVSLSGILDYSVALVPVLGGASLSWTPESWCGLVEVVLVVVLVVMLMGMVVVMLHSASNTRHHAGIP